MRLGSMITMLVVVYFLMIRMRDPGMWRWIAAEDKDEVTAGELEAKEQAKAAKTPEPIAAAEPAKTEKTQAAKTEAGKTPAVKTAEAAKTSDVAKTAQPVEEPPVPTDQDPEEWQEFRYEVQALDHDALFIKQEELEAYTRLVRWVSNQTRDVLFERAKAEEPVTFNDFVQYRDDLLGRLVFLDLQVRQVKKSNFTSPDGQDLYELWGFTNDSRGVLFCVMAVGLPKDFPVGLHVEQHALVAGYFLKLQGYEPAIAKPGERYRAPLIIGRVMIVAAPEAIGKETFTVGTMVVLLAIIAVALGGVTVWNILRGKRKRGGYRPVETTIPRPDVVSVDQWFEHIEPGAGNNPAGPSESSEGPAKRNNGNGGGQLRLFDSLDSDQAKSE